MSDRLPSFQNSEINAGLALIGAALLALMVANSPLSEFYQYLFHDLGLAHLINNVLMSVFFFVVGVEIHKEIRGGSLSDFKSAVVPIVAAAAGVVFPIIIFYIINNGQSDFLRGAAIPSATDIAFSLAVLALAGSGLPARLKILLTSIAIIDDLAAIIIIAVFYAGAISVLPLLAALICVGGMVALNRLGHTNVWYYIAGGVLMWIALFFSGVHPTMAGVATAFCLPMTKGDSGRTESAADTVIHDLHPFVSFLILPLFAFANAGISFMDIGTADIQSPLTIGIIAGLLVGKTVGISGALIALKEKELLPSQIIALGLLCAIGFTMSLFIGDLAFDSSDYEPRVRLGVMTASFIAAIAASVLLKLSPKN